MYVIKKMAISTYCVTKLSQIIFTILMGSLILSEQITTKIFIGIILVISGLILVNKISNQEKSEKISFKKYRTTYNLL